MQKLEKKSSFSHNILAKEANHIIELKPEFHIPVILESLHVMNMDRQLLDM